LLSYERPVQRAAFARSITLPVQVEPTLPLFGALAVALPTPMPTFNVRMRDAIRAVEWHVFVEGLPENPILLVEGFVAAFTWEFDTY
jgi:hypothetical protein